MIKTTVVLKNGASAQIECESVDSLVNLLTGYEKYGTNHRSAISATENQAEPVVVPTVDQIYEVTPSVFFKPKRKKFSKSGKYSESEIALIVDEIRLRGNVSRLTTDVLNVFMSKTSSSHPVSATYTFISRIKRYIYSNNKSDLSRYTIGILRKLGADKIARLQKVSSRSRSSVPAFSAPDILNISKIVYNNLHLDSGISNHVIKHIREKGDYKKRSKVSLYSITSDIKYYLRTGNESRISKKMKKIMDANMIYPVSHLLHSPKNAIVLTEA